MRLDQLNYLLAIDRYHSMNKASDNIFVSQQSISNAIIQLEEEFHTKLVLRTNKGSFLTETGQELSQAVQDFYTRCDAIKENFGPKPIFSKLHLLMEYSQLVIWDSLFLNYVTHYPNIELERTIIDYVDLENSLEEYPHSIAISYLHQEFMDKFSNQYDCYLIKTCFLSLYVPKNSPLAQLKNFSLNSLHDMNILFYAPKNKPSTLFFLLEKYDLEAKGNKYIYQITARLQKILVQRNDVVFFAPTMPLDSMVAVTLKEKLPLYLCCVSKNTRIPTELVNSLQDV